MASIDFDKLFDAIKDQVIDLAKEEGQEYLDAAREDADALLKALKKDMKEWAQKRLDGTLTEKQFKFLVKGRRDVMEMAALKQKGLAKVRLEKIINGTVDIIVSAVASSI